jgi:hypothetical protein
VPVRHRGTEVTDLCFHRVSRPLSGRKAQPADGYRLVADYHGRVGGAGGGDGTEASVAYDRTAVNAGAGGLVLVSLSAVPWGRVAAGLTGGPSNPSWGWSLFRLVSVVGFCFGLFAIWSAIKSWLSEDALSGTAKLGIALGAVTILFVVSLGPCGPATCSTD